MALESHVPATQQQNDASSSARTSPRRNRRMALLANSKLANDVQVLLRIDLAQIIQQPSTTTHHSQQSPPTRVVLGVGPHVLGQRIDPSGQYGHLNFRRPAIVVPASIFADDFLFPFFRDRHVWLRLLRVSAFVTRHLDTSNLLAARVGRN